MRIIRHSQGSLEAVFLLSVWPSRKDGSEPEGVFEDGPSRSVPAVCETRAGVILHIPERKAGTTRKGICFVHFPNPFVCPGLGRI